jgi:hypothetical protein
MANSPFPRNLSDALRRSEVPADLRDIPAVDVIYVASRDSTSRPANSGPMYTIHFAHSKVCDVVLGGPPANPVAEPITMTATEVISFYKTKVPQGFPSHRCSTCFDGPGLTDILRWGRSAKANPQLANLAVLVEAHQLTTRLEHSRKGRIERRAYGRSAPSTLQAATKFTSTRLNKLTTADRDLLAPGLENFFDAYHRLQSLLQPGTNTEHLTNKLAAYLIGTSNTRLDHTPTIMAMRATSPWIAKWYKYSSELFAALRISPADSSGVVLYGPRFAIEYFMRSTNLSSQDYAVTTTLQDHEVAKVAAGIWDPACKGPMRDLLEAIDTARMLVSTQATQPMPATANSDDPDTQSAS